MNKYYNPKLFELMVLFDGNILISNDLTAFSEHCGRFSCEVRAVIVCLSGTISVIFRGERQILKKNCMIYHSVKDISDVEIKDKNSKALIMLYATEFAGSNITLYNNIWSIIHYVSKNPVIKLTQKNMQTLNHLFKLALYYMQDKENELHEGKMKNLLNLFLFEHMTIINRIEISDKDYHEVFSNNDYILKKFLTLVNQYGGKTTLGCLFRSANAHNAETSLLCSQTSRRKKSVKCHSRNHNPHNKTTTAIYKPNNWRDKRLYAVFGFGNLRKIFQTSHFTFTDRVSQTIIPANTEVKLLFFLTVITKRCGLLTFLRY